MRYLTPLVTLRYRYAKPIVMTLNVQRLSVGNVTFAEFAQYVVDTWSSGKQLDRHWMPQNQLCHPCYIDYDFIGRFENLNNDARHVLAKITASGGPGSNATFPFQNAFDKNVPLSQIVRSFYANLSRNIVQKLIRIYKLDYQLFGYDYRWACHGC